MMMDEKTLQQAAKEIDTIEQMLMQKMASSGVSLTSQVGLPSSLPAVHEVSEKSSKVSSTVEGSNYLPPQVEGQQQQVIQPSYGFGYGGYFPPQQQFGFGPVPPAYNGVACGGGGRSVEKRTADHRADPCFWLGGGFGLGGYGGYGGYRGYPGGGYGGYWG